MEFMKVLGIVSSKLEKKQKYLIQTGLAGIVTHFVLDVLLLLYKGFLKNTNGPIASFLNGISDPNMVYGLFISLPSLLAGVLLLVAATYLAFQAYRALYDSIQIERSKNTSKIRYLKSRVPKLRLAALGDDLKLKIERRDKQSVGLIRDLIAAKKVELASFENPDMNQNDSVHANNLREDQKHLEQLQQHITVDKYKLFEQSITDFMKYIIQFSESSVTEEKDHQEIEAAEKMMQGLKDVIEHLNVYSPSQANESVAFINELDNNVQKDFVSKDLMSSYRSILWGAQEMLQYIEVKPPSSINKSH